MRRPFPTNRLHTCSGVRGACHWRTWLLYSGYYKFPPHQNYDWRYLHTDKHQLPASNQAGKPRSKIGPQAFPLKGFYKLLLENPQMPSEHQAYYPTGLNQCGRRSTDAPSQQLELSASQTPARLVFGSRLAGPRQDEDRLEDKGEVIAGIRVPPKPQEPDNCCMSGCVNCVWDVFREDLENWADARSKAQKALQFQRRRAQSGLTERPSDRNGPDTNRSTGSDDALNDNVNMWEGLDDIPIGIRVFMDTEKAIKSKKAA
ncbi:hypothetical protein TWF696_005203 [Orbilia brochopaga]|uniref:Oxidoreductase-like domain-containing protein n=1 Tax=Orbilia brochopaga TaxID=3140254 RepID=A0AAV9V2S9_9PEZI